MRDTAVMLCGHGSRDSEGIAEFERAAHGLRLRLADYDVGTGYLEFGPPTIRDGLAALAGRGARRIYAVPAMLSAASHVKHDLPREIAGFAAARPGVEVRLARELGIDGRLIAAAAERIAAAIADPGSGAALVVVGHGSSDPAANANIREIAGLVGEAMGLGRDGAGLSGVAHPRVPATLRRLAGLGWRRIVVFPYFLFTGVLVKRIYAATDAVAEEFPAIDFIKASYLGAHDLVLDTLADRVGELHHPPS
ncbi:MAG TPA: sirohydrochlorin chelatase [Stellaceae bacterium]|jgi:sirohydrochlorin cobaltochelatase